MKPQLLRFAQRHSRGMIAWLLLIVSLNASDFSSTRLYIKQSWTVLRRSNAMLIKSAEDSKIGKNKAVKLYIPEQENLPQISSRVKHELTPV
jgi:hypothetical protein